MQPPAAQSGALVPLVGALTGEVRAAVDACAARGGPVALLQAACLAMIAMLLARLEAMIQDWVAGRLPGLPPAAAPRVRPTPAPRPRAQEVPASPLFSWSMLWPFGFAADHHAPAAARPHSVRRPAARAAARTPHPDPVTAYGSAAPRPARTPQIIPVARTPAHTSAAGPPPAGHAPVSSHAPIRPAQAAPGARSSHPAFKNPPWPTCLGTSNLLLSRIVPR